MEYGFGVDLDPNSDNIKLREYCFSGDLIQLGLHRVEVMRNDSWLPIYKYKIEVVCGATTIPFIGATFTFDFTDESGDVYGLRVVRRPVDRHIVTYNSDRPKIKMIKVTYS